MFVSFTFQILLAILATGYCKTPIDDKVWKFGMELMYYTANQTNWNTVLSPLGVWSLLTEVSQATTEESAKQLRQNIVWNLKNESKVKIYKLFMEDIIGPLVEDVVLKRKNYLFVDTESNVMKDFIKKIRSQFGTKVKQLNFKMPNKAAESSNEEIKYSFSDSHKVLLPNDFNDSSEIVLTNVLAFKGLWRLPFDASKTRTVPFYNEFGDEIGEVNMMQQQGCFSYMYMPSIEAFVLELPYGKDDVYSFLVIYPSSGTNLDTVYQHFENTTIEDILSTLKYNIERNGKVYVTINLPRFKISRNIILNRPLQNMGISNIFDNQTNSFAPISNMKNLHVSAIVHNALIEVIETGTVAITTRNQALEMCTPTPSTFNPNRPFLYYIVKKSTATVIFSGAYSKPTVY